MKPPRLVNDLYRDLRDRRLLPLVIVLLIAIPAVPFVLSESTETPPAPAPDTGLSADEIPTVPAVLASNPGLRDYRKRLDALRSKDPFTQHFTEKDPATDESTVTEVDAAGGGSAAAPDGTSPTGSTPTGSTSEGDTTPTGPSGEFREFVIHNELDLEIDGPKNKRRFENVRELETLPGKKTPLLLYAGTDPEANKAVFLLSKDIVKTDGDGDCAPARDDCQVLALGEGDQRKLWYSARGGLAEKYVIKLHDIERVIERIK